MSAACLPCWQQLPRLSRGVMKLRDAAARSFHADAARWHERHGLLYQLELEQPLPRYSLWLVLDGCMGPIELGLECAGIMPELSIDVLEPIVPAQSRSETLEWMLMPWLDELEAWLGCRVVITRLDLRCAPPPTDVLALAVGVADGRRAHVALCGSGLSALADALPAPAATVPPWARVELAWLLSIRALSLHEMRALTPGALLRTRPNHLHVQIGTGGIRMAAHWLGDDAAEIEGRVDPDPMGHSAWGGHPPLVAVDELTFDVDVVLATQRLSVDQLGGLCKGAVLPLQAPFDGQRVVLMHRGAMFARGELAYVEDEMVVMITECPGSPAR